MKWELKRNVGFVDWKLGYFWRIVFVEDYFLIGFELFNLFLLNMGSIEYGIFY